MKRPEIVKSIQNALHKVAPGIKVILYGSEARVMRVVIVI